MGAPSNSFPYLNVSQRRQSYGRTREQEVPRQDRQLVPHQKVERADAAPRVGRVQNIVVQQTRHLKGRKHQDVTGWQKALGLSLTKKMGKKTSKQS